MKTVIDKQLKEILSSSDSVEVKRMKIVELIQKTLNDWTWPEKDISSGDISFKMGYNQGRNNVIDSWKNLFSISE